MKKKYIDSGVFIQAILREDKGCIKVLSDIIKKKYIGVTSLLSWDELVYILRRFINKNVAVAEGRKFLQFPNLIFIETRKEVIIKAQNLCEKYDIKPRDAIHAATAIILNIEEIISKDNDFDIINELKRINP